jgi:hypothetical protein
MPHLTDLGLQNRRQTNRKQIKDNTVPDDADPQDYVDLQQSPASRRSSLLSDDRTSSWTSTLAASGSSQASTGQPKRSGIPQLASLAEIARESEAHFDVDGR